MIGQLFRQLFQPGRRRYPGCRAPWTVAIQAFQQIDRDVLSYAEQHVCDCYVNVCHSEWTRVAHSLVRYAKPGRRELSYGALCARDCCAGKYGNVWNYEVPSECADQTLEHLRNQ